jgi:high-affinity iron transporter
MLPTFVIGLREGLEATLIVSIIATFLRQRGRLDVLRWVFAGVFAAMALCTAAGVALDVYSRNLPQQKQEALETVIGFVAVAMVTYMVVWMKRHSRDLKGQLDRAAGHALAAGSGAAFVLMAFLAVLREGLETVVFLLAAFNESGSGASAALGAVLGIASAIALGYVMYRGGIRINLSRFFRATGLVLVLVAAGLVVNALHTAHEAGWLNIGQQQTVDLSTIVRPGSVQSSLLTGMLGLQPQPVLAELIGWLVYLIPVALFVAWPPGKGPSTRTVRRVGLAGAAAAAVAALALAMAAPGVASVNRPGTPAQVLSHSAHAIEVRLPDGQTVAATRTGTASIDGIAATRYRAVSTFDDRAPRVMTLQAIARANGGRLPLGVLGSDGTPVGGSDTASVTTTSTTVTTISAASETALVLAVTRRTTETTTADLSVGKTVIGTPTQTLRSTPATAVEVAADQARSAASTDDDRGLMRGTAVVLGVVALGSLICVLAAWVTERHRARLDPPDCVDAAASIPVSSRIG